MEQPKRKGVSFTQTPEKKLFLIQPETFLEYIKELPRNERGWIAFDFQSLNKIKDGQFAKVRPTDPTIKKFDENKAA